MQEEPFQEYPALQLLAVLDSDPLVETAPLEQANACWYVWLPLAIPTDTVEFVVEPWTNAGTEYERPLTVCVEAEQFAAAAWTAEHVSEAAHP